MSQILGHIDVAKSNETGNWQRRKYSHCIIH